MKKVLALIGTSLLLISAVGTTVVPAVGTKETVGNIQDLAIEVTVQSPSAQTTPLQIICLFEYTEGDITTNDKRR